MDALDLGILREIGIEPFVGGPRAPRPWRPESLAKRLRASPRLVKDRLARLEHDRIIDGYEVLPNLALLGLSTRAYAFRLSVRGDRRSGLDRLAALDGVLAYVDYVTDWATVGLAWRGEDEHARRLAAVRGALWNAEPVTWFEPEAPPSGRAPTRLDWRLVRALRGRARRPLHEVARELGVSAKTAQRRLDRLSREGALDAFVRLSERSLDELLLCSLVFRVTPPRAEEAMQAVHGKLLGDAWTRCSAPALADGVHYDLVATARTPRGLAALLEEAARVPGVVGVEGHVASAVRWMPAWLDREIDAAAESAAR